MGADAGIPFSSDLKVYHSKFVYGKNTCGFRPKYIFITGLWDSNWGAYSALYDAEKNRIYPNNNYYNNGTDFSFVVHDDGFTITRTNNLYLTPSYCYAFG